MIAVAFFLFMLLGVLGEIKRKPGPRGRRTVSDTSNNILRTIAEGLREHSPTLSARIVGDTLTITPPGKDGFSVWLQDNAGSYTVGFDGWHEEFDAEEEALDWVAFGLSGDCRLKVVYRGSFAQSWTLESKTDEGWKWHSTTGQLVFPFWRRPRVVYLSNGGNIEDPEV